MVAKQFDLIYGGKFANVASLDGLPASEFKLFHRMLEKQVKREADQRKKDAAKAKAKASANRGRVRR